LDWLLLLNASGEEISTIIYSRRYIRETVPPLKIVAVFLFALHSRTRTDNDIEPKHLRAYFEKVLGKL
jgi:hypothetical protein